MFELMQYDIAGILSQKHRFSTREILCLSQQMFQGEANILEALLAFGTVLLIPGLEYLHSARVIHRDLKSAFSIMISP